SHRRLPGGSGSGGRPRPPGGIACRSPEPGRAGDGPGEIVERREAASRDGRGGTTTRGDVRSRTCGQSIRAGAVGMSATAYSTRRFSFAAGHKYWVEKIGRASCREGGERCVAHEVY